MRYLRWGCLLVMVAFTYACTPFLGPRTTDGGDGATRAEIGAEEAPAAADETAPGDMGIKPSPQGATCTDDSMCASGHCVDSVCCLTSSCPSCQACNLDHAGTCSSKDKGTADPACPVSTATCSAGSCDGFGKCSPAPTGTTMRSPAPGQNGTHSRRGQWTTTVAFGKQCDGMTATTASCKETAHKTCDGNLTCTADGVTCRSTCTLDVDCLSEFFCGNAGTCSPLIATGSKTACTANRQCASGVVCSSGQCLECTIDYDCRSDRPICNEGRCVACLPGLPAYCPQNAPACDNNNNCICGPPGTCSSDACAGDTQCYRGDAPFCQHGKCGCAGGPCPAPYTCIATGSSAASPRCVLPVGLPCLNDTDCGPNKCINGLCTYSTACSQDSICSQDSDCTATCTSSPCETAACSKGTCVAACNGNDDQCSSMSCVANVCSTPRRPHRVPRRRRPSSSRPVLL